MKISLIYPILITLIFVVIAVFTQKKVGYFGSLITAFIAINVIHIILDDSEWPNKHYGLASFLITGIIAFSATHVLENTQRKKNKQRNKKG